MTDTTKRQQYLAAVRVDILDMLQKENPGVYEFNRISDISRLMVGLVGATDKLEESEAVKGVLRAAEFKAPTLHQLLLDTAFDAKSLLREKYKTLVAQEHQLKLASLNISEAADRIKVEETRLTAQQEALVLHEKHLERERERLQLSAAIQGVQLVLPPLPKLSNPDDDEDPVAPPPPHPEDDREAP